MKDIVDVKLSRQALKDLRKVPLYIAIKVQAWVDDVGHRGLMAVRKVPGYHDEPLKGERLGQRSIRLSRAYRAIYVIDEHRHIQFVEIVEVNKHDY
jgi:toxin HigB-1